MTALAWLFVAAYAYCGLSIVLGMIFYIADDWHAFRHDQPLAPLWTMWWYALIWPALIVTLFSMLKAEKEE